MFRIHNILEEVTIFEGKENQLLEFAYKVAKENGDGKLKFMWWTDVRDYIKEYCPNLEFVAL